MLQAINSIGAPALNYVNQASGIITSYGSHKNPFLKKNSWGPVPLEAKFVCRQDCPAGIWDAYKKPCIGVPLTEGLVSYKPMAGPPPSNVKNMTELSEKTRKEHEMLYRIQQDKIKQRNFAGLSQSQRLQAEKLYRDAIASKQEHLRDMEILQQHGFTRETLKNDILQATSGTVHGQIMMKQLVEATPIQHESNALVLAANRYGIPLPEDLKTKEAVPVPALAITEKAEVPIVSVRDLESMEGIQEANRRVTVSPESESDSESKPKRPSAGMRGLGRVSERNREKLDRMIVSSKEYRDEERKQLAFDTLKRNAEVRKAKRVSDAEDSAYAGLRQMFK